MALSTVSSSGTQANTQNPQTAPSSSDGTSTSSIQPGTTTSLLSNGGNDGSVPLGGSTVTTVSLNSGTSTPTISNPPIKHHHTSPVLLGVVVGLFALALIMFWFTSQTEKITTK